MSSLPGRGYQQVFHAGEKNGVHGDVGRVVIQELLLARLVFGGVGREPQGHAQQAARAMRGHGAQLFIGQGGQAAAQALLIGRRRQVGGGIGQGAVEIEKNQRFHERIVATM